ncbi:hypothetical protein [Shewanella gelidii]|uniref:CHAD domain-containing protein n=1 Tax=Shewanella gelidii TaxID=1642821 RepID=A0A917JKG8_9GAMM|nr:hypothetical protein [Shewanella gelidii]MCL1096882.1 hypothetical protein [Shewanella gelidii]GGI70858.1 hypothetical protein GCM10009332_05230 [Shewanella gelidii]
MAGMLIRVLTIVSLLFLTGCGDDRVDKIEKYQQLTEKRVSSLADMLNNGQIRNANLLSQYADIVAQEQPTIAPLVSELARDSKGSGPMFSSLTQRLNELKDSSNFVDLDQQLSEAENLYQATDPSLFNDMLSDPVNVIADMSNGKLSRVNSISREAEALANSTEDIGAGSQLVGNPSYGQWQSSGGTSFWAWYGMYSMFSNIMHGPVYYDRWSSRRGYSYYNDVGRYRYTSPKQASAQNKTFERTKKQFSSQGKRFDSPYAKKRTGATALSRSSQSTPKSSATGKSSPKKFRSNYAKDSSFRNSSSRTTRGIRRGK